MRGGKETQDLRGRELEVMELLRERGESSVEDIRRGLSGTRLSPSTVRTVLNRLVEKSHAAVDRRDGRNVYRPVRASPSARRTAVERVVTTFFDGSAVSAALTLLDTAAAADINDPEVRRRLERLVDELRQGEQG